MSIFNKLSVPNNYYLKLLFIYRYPSPLVYTVKYCQVLLNFNTIREQWMEHKATEKKRQRRNVVKWTRAKLIRYLVCIVGFCTDIFWYFFVNSLIAVATIRRSKFNSLKYFHCRRTSDTSVFQLRNYHRIFQLNRVVHQHFYFKSNGVQAAALVKE